jgi:hypothetical protein
MKKGKIARAAMGLRVHSGWAALVVVGGSLRSPTVVDRRRIVIADPAIRGSKQPFHAAEKLELKEAAAHIARCKASTRKLAQVAIGSALRDVHAKEQEVIGCGLLLSSGRPVGTLKEALASHPMLHTAEGQFFRDALREASEHFGLAVTGVREKELFARAAETLYGSESELRRHVAEMGKKIGPPWGQDEKMAALVGWMALEEGVRGEGRGGREKEKSKTKK